MSSMPVLVAKAADPWRVKAERFVPSGKIMSHIGLLFSFAVSETGSVSFRNR